MPTDFPSDAEDASLVAKARAGDNAEPLTVSEISQALKRTVEDRFGFVRLRGELSGVKRAANGHMYCALKDEKAVLKPGPNGPVGVVWIDLSKDHYGIHGTPEPQNIGRTQSHGCIRLTNWDAARLAQMVKSGVKAKFQA